MSLLLTKKATGVFRKLLGKADNTPVPLSHNAKRYTSRHRQLVGAGGEAYTVCYVP
jgi:hypothetical protein